MVSFKSTSFVVVLCAALVGGIALAAPNNSAPDNNGPSGVAARAAAPATASLPHYGNHGHFVCTAAINANGTVFSGEYVDAGPNPNQTHRLGPGTYQVVFKTSSVSADDPCADVRIALGWYRVCQPDTLQYGTLPPRICIVADRWANNPGVWVQIYDNAGNLVDTSFTLHVSR